MRHCEALPDLTYCCIFAWCSWILCRVKFRAGPFAGLDLRASQHPVAEHAVFARVSWEGLVLRLKIGSITYMVHLIVTRLLLIHWYYARCAIVGKEFGLFGFSVLLKLVYMTSGASLGNIEISCYLLSTSDLLFNIVVTDIGISLWNLCLGVVNISIVNGVTEADFSVWD